MTAKPVGYFSITLAKLFDRVTPVPKTVFGLAERHLDSPNIDGRLSPRHCFAHYEKSFAFIEHDRVEPTNSGAEHALCQAVQWFGPSP